MVKRGLGTAGWSRYLEQWAGHGAAHRRDERDGHNLGVSIPEAHECMGGAHTPLHNSYKKSNY